MEEVQAMEYVSKLDIQSMGPDGCTDEIARPPSKIFVQSWQLGEVSKDRNKWNVAPIFKKGKKEDLRNYRPVRLTPPGKVMEQLILRTISRNMKENKIVSSSQYGFTKGKSRLTNLISFFDEMTSLVDEGGAIDIIFLDFSKAFDTATQKILLEKLLKYGLSEQAVQ